MTRISRIKKQTRQKLSKMLLSRLENKKPEAISGFEKL